MSTLPSSERRLDDEETVLVLFANSENRALMGDMLRAAGYGVSNVFPAVSGRPVDVRDFDLCIVDGPSLSEYWDRLLAVQAQQQPVPLPVLFFSDRRDIGLTTRNLWHVVDDVVERPVDKLTLRARIETLIRSRRLALQVRRLAGLYEHERHIAQRFQEAALPRALPHVAGLSFSAFYSPATNEAYVGGDWYDAARLPDGRVILSIGDVCGFGLDAAVAMANVRQVVRGVAQIHPDPAVMLDAADRTLHDADEERIVTAFVGVFDPVTSLLNYASAGHPRPLLRYADGSVTELGAFGLPLGLPMRTDPRTTESVTLPEGSLLVLFTDGLTEATHDLLAGEQRLRAIIASGAIMDAPNIAQAIGKAVLPEHSNDDVAILTVATTPRDAGGDAPLRWSFDAGDITAARAARFEYAADLTRHGISPSDLISAELIFAELLGNVVRYAPGSTEMALTWASSVPVLHVLDSGPGFRHFPKLPIDLLNERGRGLFIVSSLAQEFAVDARPGGGSHARAILPFHVRERRRLNEEFA